MAKTTTALKKERKAKKEGKDLLALQLANNAAEIAKKKKSGSSEVRRTRNQTAYEIMKSSNFIDTVQASAGDYLQMLHQNSHYGVPAMDPSKVIVDGGKPSYEIPDHVIDAQNKIGACNKAVGMFVFAVVYKFVCEEKSAEKVAEEFFGSGDREEKYYRRLCRDGLEEVARHFNFRRTERKREHVMRSEVVRVIPEYWKERT